MAKTLNDFLDEHINVFPSEVDQATRDLIIQWFGYRQVAHSVFFPNWLMRTLERDYPRYVEETRIEARIAGSEYDWLVTKYLERQVETKNTDNTEKTSQGTKTQNNTRTFAAGTTEVTVENDTDRGTGSVTDQHTGTENNLMTRNLVTDVDGTKGTIDNTSTSITRTPNLSSEVKESNNNTSRHGALQRITPMDAEYAGNNPSLNDNVSHGVGSEGVDVNPNNVMLNNSHFMGGFPNLSIQNPSSASDELVDASNITYNTTSQTGVESTTTDKDRSSDETTDLTTSETGTENKLRTVNLTDAGVRDLTDTHNGRKEITKGGQDVDTSNMSGSDSKTDNEQNSFNGLVREIYTGRGGEREGNSPQDLLKSAVEFIEKTSAWKFLYRQIDKCFMMCYDIDEYEEV